MQTYTVLLRYPDYMADDWPNDLYTDTVECADHLSAVTEARANCMRDNVDSEGACFIDDADDLALVCAIEGAPMIHWESE